MADRFAQLHEARARFVLLYDSVMPAVVCGDDALLPTVISAAEEVWRLMGHTYPLPLIELCLPENHQMFMRVEMEIEKC